MKRAGRVAIVVLHWGAAEVTLSLLEDLKLITEPEFHIFLVDQTGSLKLPSSDNLTVIRPQTNLGYAAGNNLALERVMEQSFEYCLLLNNDVQITQKDLIDRLIRALEDDLEAAAAAPTILYPGEDQQIWFGGGEMLWKRGAVQHLRLREQFSSERVEARVQSVSFLTGCCLMVRVQALKDVGVLDTHTFIYWEDADWCARALESKKRLLYVPDAVLVHKVSLGLDVNSPTYLYYIFRNNLWFIRRHVKWPWKLTAWGFLLYKVAKELVKLFVRYRRNYRGYLKHIWLAFYHNAIRRYGKQ